MWALLLSKLSNPLIIVVIGVTAVAGIQTIRVASVKSELAKERQSRAEAATRAAEAYSTELKRRDDEFARVQAEATKLGADLAVSDAQHAITRIERDDAIRLATKNRPCLSSSAVGVLNRPTGSPDVPKVPETSSGQQNVGEDAAGTPATDTDVALWISAAKEQYAKCAKRLADWQEWYGDLP